MEISSHSSSKPRIVVNVLSADPKLKKKIEDLGGPKEIVRNLNNNRPLDEDERMKIMRMLEGHLAFYADTKKGLLKTTIDDMDFRLSKMESQTDIVDAGVKYIYDMLKDAE